jgi:hypothetical protein
MANGALIEYCVNIRSVELDPIPCDASGKNRHRRIKTIKRRRKQENGFCPERRKGKGPLLL